MGQDANVLLIKGAISELSPEEQHTIRSNYEELKEAFERINNKNGMAHIAFALLGAELAAEK